MHFMGANLQALNFDPFLSKQHEHDAYPAAPGQPCHCEGRQPAFHHLLTHAVLEIKDLKHSFDLIIFYIFKNLVFQSFKKHFLN